MNPIRFYEYALSSSLMIVLIGQLVGIWDLGSIILIFFLNATMNLFGIMMEYHNQYTEKTNWLSFVYGSVAGIIPWVVIMIYFLSAINSSGAKPPAFVYAIIPTIFVFFNSFAINMILQYKKVGAWKDYLVGERAYIILSLSAKTALAWMISQAHSHLYRPRRLFQARLNPSLAFLRNLVLSLFFHGLPTMKGF